MATFMSFLKNKLIPSKDKIPMWRHGDVFIAAVAEIPPKSQKLKHTTLAEGELTGHMHRIKEPKVAELFDSLEPSGDRYLRVTAANATLVHQEHAPIEIPRGEYRVWIQREYSPEAIRRVID